MANHASHAALPYPIKGARFSIQILYLDADGDPTDPVTPDTEVSKDGAAFADCAEEISVITGSNGVGWFTLSGAETDASMVALAGKVASGPKNTLATLYPRVLAVLETGTAQAGAAGSITLASGAAAYDVSGCFVRTTGGTGGGGTGGANNQARRVTVYNTSTKVATVVPNWETTPASDTTYEVLLPEGMTGAAIRALNPSTAGRLLDVSIDGDAEANVTKFGGTNGTFAGGRPEVNTSHVSGTAQTAGDVIARLPAALVSGRMDSSVGAMAANVVTALAVAGDAVTEIQAGLATSSALTAVATEVTTILADTGLLKGAVRATVVMPSRVDFPESGSERIIQVRLMLSDYRGAAVAATGTPTVTCSKMDDGTAFGSFGAVSNPGGATGIYQATLTIPLVDIATAMELPIRIDWSATVGGIARTFTAPASVTIIRLGTQSSKLHSTGLDTVIPDSSASPSLNLKQFVCLIGAANLGTLSGAAGPTTTIKGANNAVTRIQATVDSTGRTLVTLSP